MYLAMNCQWMKIGDFTDDTCLSAKRCLRKHSHFVVNDHHKGGWERENGSVAAGGLFQNSCSLFVWDKYHAHHVKKSTNNGYNTNIPVIPGGLTSLLQSLNTCLNYPVNCRVWEQWIWWSGENSCRNFKSLCLSIIITLV